jgi:putative nucleotidyltransferase with HDIG domain
MSWPIFKTEERIMQINPSGTTGQDNVRKYFRTVMERHELPALPFVASKVLDMIQDPDLNVRQLCRVLSDDAALAARILAVSRSAHYAQRNLPTNLLGAVQVLGFRTLRNVVITIATQGLFLTNNKISEKMWSHSLAVALASRILSARVGFRDTEQAFLAGLLHDVGEMILLHGDPKGFERLGQEVQQAQCLMIDKEQEVYGFDHTLIGLTLLDSWNIDAAIGQAVLHHHSETTDENSNGLGTILALADYFCFKADLGFFAPPRAPSGDILAKWACDTDALVDETVQKIRTAFEQESALFRMN